jgi:hypothetical protein
VENSLSFAWFGVAQPEIKASIMLAGTAATRTFLRIADPPGDSGGAKRRGKLKERGDRAQPRDFHIPTKNAVLTALQPERVEHLCGSLFIKRGSFRLIRLKA